MTPPRRWTEAIVAAGAVRAAYVPEASTGRSDALEPTAADLRRELGERCAGRLGPEEWLVVDGLLSESRVLAEHPRALGVIKSHGAQYFEGAALERALTVPADHRTSAFRPLGHQHQPVYSWYLRLWPWQGNDLLYGLLRIEARPTPRASRRPRRCPDGCCASAPRSPRPTRAGTACCILYTTWRPTCGAARQGTCSRRPGPASRRRGHDRQEPSYSSRPRRRHRAEAGDAAPVPLLDCERNHDRYRGHRPGRSVGAWGVGRRACGVRRRDGRVRLFGPGHSAPRRRGCRRGPGARGGGADRAPGDSAVDRGGAAADPGGAAPTRAARSGARGGRRRRGAGPADGCVCGRSAAHADPD